MYYSTIVYTTVVSSTVPGTVHCSMKYGCVFAYICMYVMILLVEPSREKGYTLRLVKDSHIYIVRSLLESYKTSMYSTV